MQHEGGPHYNTQIQIVKYIRTLYNLCIYIYLIYLSINKYMSVFQSEIVQRDADQFVQLMLIDPLHASQPFCFSVYHRQHPSHHARMSGEKGEFSEMFRQLI